MHRTLQLQTSLVSQLIVRRRRRRFRRRCSAEGGDLPALFRRLGRCALAALAGAREFDRRGYLSPLVL